MTDNQIVETIRDSGIKDCDMALSTIYKSYYTMVESFVVKNSGTKEDAKDVFQETVLSLYNNIKNDKYTVDSKLSTYLFSISRNNWFKKLRKNGRMSHMEEKNHLQLSSDDDIHKEIEYTEQQQLIGKLLHKVGSDCSKILKLFYFEKQRMVKIATTMDYSSEQVAKNQKSKCMKKLRAVVMSSTDIQYQLSNS